MKNPRTFTIHTQPDDATCGPTCLHSVYNYYHDPVDLSLLIKEVEFLREGGTLAVMLGNHALKRGYKASLYTYDLQIFDPTWKKLGQRKLIDKLHQSFQISKKPKQKLTLKSFIEFLTLGGKVCFDDLSPELITGFIKKKIPVITGLSSTYLYQSKREYGRDGIEDDILGQPCGHFVVLYDQDVRKKKIKLADPWGRHPFGKSRNYEVPVQKLINAILLGVLTYDSNLLILTPSLKKHYG